MKKTLIFNEGGSHKFWTIEIIENSFSVIYGKVGTAGVTNTKSFDTNEEASKEATKLIESKIKKGYNEHTDNDFDENKFWGLISRARSKAEDPEEIPELLVDMLFQRSIDDIMKFHYFFDKFHSESYTSELWGAAYLMNGGCSDDGFDYFRGWLIAQGKDNYNKAIENPDSLVKLYKPDEYDEYELESMLSVALDAFCQKTEKEIEDFYEQYDSIYADKIEKNFDIEFNWTEEGDELKTLLPKLYKKCIDN